jgi:ribosomal protein L1
VAVFAEGADADEARAAGADIVGGVELIDQIASKRTVLLFLYGAFFSVNDKNN